MSSPKKSSISPDTRDALQDAVRILNTQGLDNVARAYNILASECSVDKVSSDILSHLNNRGRALYVIAGIQSFIRRAGLTESTSATMFGGVRCMCVVPARGTHYLIALDTSIDVNGGTVVTQWVTRQTVQERNIPRLLSPKSSIMRDSEPSGDYFEKYSEINAVTTGVRRTPHGMERAVLQRFHEKVNQLHSGT
jgi:hypothetical protein